MDRPETTEIVEADEPVVLPDRFAALYCRCTPGDIVFVESNERAAQRRKARRKSFSECVAGYPLVMLLTVRVERADALAQIAEGSDA